jgi:hypothetical protein
VAAGREHCPVQKGALVSSPAWKRQYDN